MKVVLQRVKSASVEIDSVVKADINAGYLLLVGFEAGDGEYIFNSMIDKIRHIRLFPDENGRFAHSLEETKGSLLIVSQFTLSADLKKGKKPSFTKAMEPTQAEQLYHSFVEAASQTGVPVQSGVFGAMMQVKLQNDGPVTVLLDSKRLFPALHAKHGA